MASSDARTGDQGIQEMSQASAAIACNLDALLPAERSRRSELAQTIRKSATSIEETDRGYRLQLSNDAEICKRALELILLERRCCPFLSIELEFPPGDGAVVLVVGGAPGVKDFLRETGVLAGAPPAERSSCC